MGILRKLKTVTGWTMCSRVLGLIRDRLLATSFGASTTLDAFMIAFSLPNLFRQLFGEGTLSAAFTPRYIKLREQAAGRPMKLLRCREYPSPRVNILPAWCLRV